MRALAAAVVLLGARVALAGPPPLHVGYDAEHLDLDKHELQFRPTRAITSAKLVVIGDDGNELASAAQTYDGAKPGAWLPITWSPRGGAAVMKLELDVIAPEGAVTHVSLIPWSVTVEHEDVNFRSDSADLDADEAKKLDASLGKIEDVAKKTGKFLKLQLYVAGHTDTVGPSAKNRDLSRRRALAIGTYFRKHGLAIPVVVAGFGEDVLKVKTPDNTDERANRRADYVLGPAGGSPPFKGPYLKAKATWSQLK
jgi:outer membrane protein OmpA-like peptidoglycan-associated protein